MSKDVVEVCPNDDDKHRYTTKDKLKEKYPYAYKLICEIKKSLDIMVS